MLILCFHDDDSWWPSCCFSLPRDDTRSLWLGRSVLLISPHTLTNHENNNYISSCYGNKNVQKPNVALVFEIKHRAAGGGRKTNIFNIIERWRMRFMFFTLYLFTHPGIRALPPSPRRCVQGRMGNNVFKQNNCAITLSAFLLWNKDVLFHLWHQIRTQPPSHKDTLYAAMRSSSWFTATRPKKNYTSNKEVPFSEMCWPLL